jgi:hypothetical protein
MGTRAREQRPVRFPWNQRHRPTFFLRSQNTRHLHQGICKRWVIAAGRRSVGEAMKDFSEASFVPEVVSAMTEALDASVAKLPHPVSSTQVNLLAESILRTAQQGERDPAVLQRMALLELQITPRH